MFASTRTRACFDAALGSEHGLGSSREFLTTPASEHLQEAITSAHFALIHSRTQPALAILMRAPTAAERSVHTQSLIHCLASSAVANVGSDEWFLAETVAMALLPVLTLDEVEAIADAQAAVNIVCERKLREALSAGSDVYPQTLNEFAACAWRRHLSQSLAAYAQKCGFGVFQHSLGDGATKNMFQRLRMANSSTSELALEEKMLRLLNANVFSLALAHVSENPQAHQNLTDSSVFLRSLIYAGLRCEFGDNIPLPVS